MQTLAELDTGNCNSMQKYTSINFSNKMLIKIWSTQGNGSCF